MRTATLSVLALLVLAGCASPANDAPAAERSPADALPVGPPVALVEDAAADAYEGSWEQTRGSLPCVSAPAAPVPVPVPCYPEAPHPALGMTSATQAAPARDITGLEVQETPTTLEVRLELAGLDESLAGAVDRDGGEGTIYVVDLYRDDECLVALWQFLWPMPDEVERMSVLYTECGGGEHMPATEDADGIRDTPCGHSDCAWGVPTSIAYGTPAVIAWSVPRELLASSVVADGFEGSRGHTVRIAQPDGSSPEHEGTTVRGPLEMTFFPPDTIWYLVDTTDAGPAFAFARPHPAIVAPTFPLRVVGDGLERAGSPRRPDARILDYLMEDLQDRLRLTATLAAVDETPQDHGLELGFTMPGNFVNAGYAASAGERHSFANVYSSNGTSVGLPVVLTVVPGQPGRIVVEIARTDLPPIAPGALAAWTFALTSEARRNTTQAGAMAVEAEFWRALDFVCCGPAVAFGAVPALAADPGIHRVTGTAGDARLPPDAFSASAARFDLQTLEVASAVPGEVRFTLGIGDLSSLDPPDAYDAIFYAVGVEHESARTMVGYYRGVDRPEGEFFCATDATVLAEQPQDPVRSPDWIEVGGRVLVATDSASLSQGAGGAAAGSAAFVIAAPTTCFGLDDEADILNVTQIGAGSYLVRRTTQRLPETQASQTVTRVDALPPTERPFMLALAQPIISQPSFWEAPFGLENGWDVIGAALAVLTVAITLGLFVRRRRLMRWYVDEIARVDKAYLADPISRAKSLVALRRRLHRDILRHRVSDAEYIRDRLRSSLTSARLVTVSDGFYGLPAALAMRLERMLDDGRMTAEESKLIEPLVERAAIPPEARALLIERLRSWVEEDSITA